MGDKVGVLNAGRVIQVGTPQEIYNRPRDTFVAGFVGSPAINLVAAELGDGKVSAFADRLRLALEGAGRGSAPDGPVTVGIRSEDIRVGPDQAVAARVHDVENHGVEKLVTLRIDDHLFKATVPATMRVAVEDEIRFGWNPHKLHLFDTASGLRLG